MKILYSAFACNPYIGSEAQCGWAWAEAMRNYSEVSIITREENRNSIQRYLKEEGIDNVTMYYHDAVLWSNIFTKHEKMYFIYYIAWQYTVEKAISKIYQTNKFDLVQHITLGDYRVVPPLWKTGIDYVFGPVGGAQTTPNVFYPYVKDHRIEELKRTFINHFMLNLPWHVKSLNHAKYIFAANEETKIFLQKKIKQKEKCDLLTENGVYYVKESPCYDMDRENNTVFFLWAGRLIYRKGLDFLVDVVSEIDRKLDYKFVILGDGPERKILLAKCNDLGISDRMHFVGKIPYEEMGKYYRQADVFVFPSLRETTGTVLFEAMSNGLPVISLEQNGAKLLIDETCGRLVPIKDRNLRSIIQQFKEHCEELIKSEELRKKLGKGAMIRMENYTWDNKCKQFLSKYC